MEKGLQLKGRDWQEGLKKKKKTRILLYTLYKRHCFDQRYR